MVILLNNEPYSAEQLNNDIIQLARTYKEIIQYVTIGVSHDNRDILMLKLGKGSKHILFCSGVHGRESVNPIVMMALTEYYAVEYLEQYEMKENSVKHSIDNGKSLDDYYHELLYRKCIYELLETYTILIIPLLNPDGYTIATDGFDSIQDDTLRKELHNNNISHEQWKFNGRAVDINRNFPSVLWREQYEGDSPGSENESKALMDVFWEYPLEGFIDLHSRGKSIYYYRQTMSDHYNQRQVKIAERLKEVMQYELVPPSDEIDPGDSGGNTVHYYSENYYKVALTIETVPEEASFPLQYKYRKETFEELKYLFFELGSLLS